VDVSTGGGGVSVLGIAGGEEVSGTTVDGIRVGKPGSSASVGGSGVPTAVHANRMGKTKKVR